MNQCMSIIQLTSLDWSRKERFGLVGHSFRVMAKAKNRDEMVVGFMHALYAGSGYTRDLFDIDVDGNPEWKAALDLFVPRVKMKRPKSKYNVPPEDLLSTNMPQNLSEEERQKWMIEETRWNKSYSRSIQKISTNRIARNVMIYKLEDMLDVLRNPGKFEDESGFQYYILPWKKHYMVNVRHRQMPVPRKDDALLLREPTVAERENLIGKYEKALKLLREVEEEFPVIDEYTEEEHLKHEKTCQDCFHSWMKQEIEDMEQYRDEDDEEEEDYYEEECAPEELSY